MTKMSTGGPERHTSNEMWFLRHACNSRGVPASTFWNAQGIKRGGHGELWSWRDKNCQQAVPSGTPMTRVCPLWGFSSRTGIFRQRGSSPIIGKLDSGGAPRSRPHAEPSPLVENGSRQREAGTQGRITHDAASAVGRPATQVEQAR